MSALALLLCSALSSASSAQTPPRSDDFPNVVVRWNEVALQAIRTTRTSPPKASRALAMTHMAVYEAVNAVDGSCDAYLVKAIADPRTSMESAAVAAAHDVLVSLFPDLREALDREQSQDFSRFSDQVGHEAGVELGRMIAVRVVEWRKRDDSDRGGRYFPRNRPGFWQPTKEGQEALLPEWGYVGPFAIKKGTQYEPPRPPSLESEEYAKAFDEVKRLGSKESIFRTPEQTQIAHFWADDVGTVTPPGHWNKIAQGFVRERRLGLAATARLYALLNISLADAGVLCWVLKFTHEFWRPMTAIRLAETDNNPATEKDAEWTPLLNTPPFPAYTSGHSTFSSAGAGILAYFNQSEAYEFSTVSDGLPGVTRSFKSFRAAAEEAGMSRIYGGIHWQFDNVEGLKTGFRLAEYATQNYLRPRVRNVARPVIVFPE